MRLERDQMLGEYRIVEPIGAGGMGEVYRAHDARLDRDVAIKVLPGAVANDPQALARFGREAKAIAALSHPNILAVHDFGQSADVWYVVMELLEGETLRDRLAQGKLAARKAAELGRQIARGLAAAHDKGIVHRDLKPENLFLTREGRVKILDFGLAADILAQTQNDATRTHLTAPGSVVGTVSYMSPEQVRSEPVDARSDIFSFGTVLYEMLSGTRPFRHDTGAETMTSILKEDPPELETVVTEVPAALATIVRRCMEKQPGQRFQSAHDLAFSLEALSSSAVVSGASHPATAVDRPGRGFALRGVAVLLLGAALGAGAYALLSRPAPAEAPTVLTISLQRGVVTGGRFTPGRQVTYSATWQGAPLDVFLAGADGGTRSLQLGVADLLDVSPSGELALAIDRRFTIGWEAVGTLALATAQGSAPRPVLEDVYVADWAPDGKNLAVAHEVDGIVRLEYPIGTVLYEAPGWISDVRIHPDGERVAFADNPVRGDNTAFVRIVDRQGKVEDLGRGGSWGLTWTPDGKDLVVGSGLTVRIVRPGASSRGIYSAPTSLRILDISDTGNLLVASADVRREMFGRAPGESTERNLSWLDWTTPRELQPDGRVAVFEEGNEVGPDGYSIYVRGTDGSAPVRIGEGTAIAVSPDARWVLSIRGVFGDDPRAVLIPTGAGETRVLASLGDLRVRPRGADWVPSPGSDPGASAIVFQASAPDEPTRLYFLTLDADATPRPLTAVDFPLAAQGVAVAPDGRSVAVLPIDGPAVRISLDGTDPVPIPGVKPGEIPLRFDRDGRHLYVQASNRVPSPIVRVDVRTGAREAWFELTPTDPAGVFSADYVEVSDDGSAYLYSSRRVLSRLVLLSGLQALDR